MSRQRISSRGFFPPNDSFPTTCRLHRNPPAVSGTPSGCVRFEMRSGGVRSCLARPPANFRHPSGNPESLRDGCACHRSQHSMHDRLYLRFMISVSNVLYEILTWMNFLLLVTAPRQSKCCESGFARAGARTLLAPHPAVGVFGLCRKGRKDSVAP